MFRPEDPLDTVYHPVTYRIWPGPARPVLTSLSRKSGTVLEKTECSVFLGKYYFRACFLTSYWILVLASLVCCQHSLQSVHLYWIFFSDFLDLTSLHSWLHWSIRGLPAVQPETGELEVRTGEREKATLGLGTGQGQYPVGGEGGPAQSLLSSHRVK